MKDILSHEFASFAQPGALIAMFLVLLALGIGDAAIGSFSDSIPVVIYRPSDLSGPLPAVVFLPGRVAPESQYESYARALASRGFVVAVRGWYSPLLSDEELLQHEDAILEDAKAERPFKVDPKEGFLAHHADLEGKGDFQAAVDGERAVAF